ncbi:TRAP transporter small permease subunit [Sabulicella glaciei]|uniref:TRAP transporter small permease protein n=1 Tax=Sabulicella glaciei TaxID=2984948 RepID=A0ABT3P0L4_9PROT|nr:TRAP transporter small permease subunit [Roseococcus sp. MDT2-1-1]MCW8087905.1 TRAP transporter small permease subunit [Roseococcus sp. MDT2-1-1]
MTDSLVVGGLAGLVVAALIVGIAFSGAHFVQRALLAVDRFSTLIGQVFAWTIILLTASIVYEVFARRFFSSPTNWGYDVQYMLYGMLFMFAGAYALSRNGHVRGDFLYRMMEPRKQAMLDCLLYVLFFFPAIFAFMVAGWHFFELSWIQNERSMFSPSGPIIWPFKGIIPIVGFIMLLQGLVETVRCVRCIRTGHWPQRLSDVEELDQIILARAAEAEDLEDLARKIAEGDDTTLTNKST